MKQQCQSSGISEPQAHPLGLGKTPTEQRCLTPILLIRVAKSCYRGQVLQEALAVMLTSQDFSSLQH